MRRERVEERGVREEILLFGPHAIDDLAISLRFLGIPETQTNRQYAFRNTRSRGVVCIVLDRRETEKKKKIEYPRRHVHDERRDVPT